MPPKETQKTDPRGGSQGGPSTGKDSSREQAQKDVQKEINESNEANENDPQAMFNIYLFNSLSNTASMEKFVNVGSVKNVKSKTLAEIRKSLISENALSMRQKSSRFCNNEGAEVEDKLTFEMYLQFLADSEEEPEESGANDSQGTAAKKTKGNKGQPIVRNTDKGETYKVYLKSRKLPTEMDETTRELLKRKLDLDMAKPENATAQVDKLTSSYNHKDFMALAAKTVTHPADMGEREWYIVMQNNSILHGNYVRQVAEGERRVERAMYPAFALKARKFHDYEAIFDSNGSGAKSQTTEPATDPDLTVHHLRIPRFLVQDDSYVRVSENKTSVSEAIANSSLSEHSAEVSVGGGAFGISAGAKVGYKKQDSSKSASSTIKDTKRMTITYNFPRVVLELDGESLAISDECKRDLEAVTTAQGVNYFRRKYGTFFATRVELGGRLHSSESSDSFAQAKVEEKARMLKIAAAASFSSTYGSGSASGSWGQSGSDSSDNKNSSFSMNLSWEAKGGDTLLANNPSAWCGTVASYYNWRISQQDDLLSIEEMISLLPGYEGVKRKFDTLVPPMVNGRIERPEKLPKDWDGWVTFWLKDPNEDLYPTAVDGPQPLPEKMKDLPPSTVEWYRKNLTNYNSPYRFKMMEDDKNDYKTQIFQAGYKFYETYDGKKVHHRFKPGHQYILSNDKAEGTYIGATPPVPGGTQRTELVTTTFADCAYFRFTHAFETDRLYIINRDLVRVEIFDKDHKSLGLLKNMPPLGSYGTSGDVFCFRYKGEP